MDSTFNTGEIGGIIAAGIPAGTRTRIGNTVNNAVLITPAGRGGVPAGEFQRFPRKTNARRARIPAEQFAVNRIEILLRAGIIRVPEAAHIIIQHHFQPV